MTGVKENNIYFLDMPFYETGTIKKSVINEKDISIVYELIEKINPD